MQPFDSMQFCHSWRPYQLRVLDAVKEHLDDKRLHVVAAPGAGKTTLGLEVFRLLGKTTLILSPTRIIRDQWVDRLRDFCDDTDLLDWVSTSIHEPKTLTSITYQALHSQLADQLTDEEEQDLSQDKGLKKEEINGFIQTIERHKIEVLMLDEAHHLTSEWWKALESICRKFPDIILVSLTATPPYDAKSTEWSRYEQLCGPIDEEISVPELVKAGTLSPHQDFIWACNTSQGESKQIEEYDARVSTLCHSLFHDAEFAELVQSHPWLHCQTDAASILKEPKIAVALLTYLHAKQLTKHPDLMSLLDMNDADIPELGRFWWQTLLETLLFSKTNQFNDKQAKFVERLKKQLKASELLHRRELSLERSRRIERSLSLSTSKISACEDIHRLEWKKRGATLRQVVLTDYIRDEEIASGLDTGELNLGAWPIFRHLTITSEVPEQIALLTGRISIVPTQWLSELQTQIKTASFKAEPIGDSGQYHRVIAPLNQLTAAFTYLLANGHIKVLVGTRSLLGEGWDAPQVNSLILASTVGSFMLTNQMRGRAIRIDREQSNKISSIWHLVAVNPRSHTGWSDYGNLCKRFETFVGLSEKELTIESGFSRVNATALEAEGLLTESGPITGNNRQMTARFNQLEKVAERWNQALTVNESARVIPSVETERPPEIRGVLIRRSFAFLLGQFMVFAVCLMMGSLYLSATTDLKTLFLTLTLVTGGFVLYKLPASLSVIKTLCFFLPIDGALKQMGKALKESLCEAGFIQTSQHQLNVNVTQLHHGGFYVSLHGGSFYESSLFADSFAEMLAPLDNPRYLISRQGTFLGGTRKDYHAVPLKLGAKKEVATQFLTSWQKHVSRSELIYTRTDKGRQHLLKAKMAAFSANFRDEVKRQDRWH